MDDDEVYPDNYTSTSAAASVRKTRSAGKPSSIYSSPSPGRTKQRAGQVSSPLLKSPPMGRHPGQKKELLFETLDDAVEFGEFLFVVPMIHSSAEMICHLNFVVFY